ncbi:allophanate hydrolase, partial [Rhizobium ruizarguesonis]
MIAKTNRHASQLEIVPATKSRARVSS